MDFTFCRVYSNLCVEHLCEREQQDPFNRERKWKKAHKEPEKWGQSPRTDIISDFKVFQKHTLDLLRRRRLFFSEIQFSFQRFNLALTAVTDLWWGFNLGNNFKLKKKEKKGVITKSDESGCKFQTPTQVTKWLTIQYSHIVFSPAWHYLISITSSAC